MSYFALISVPFSWDPVVFLYLSVGFFQVFMLCVDDLKILPFCSQRRILLPGHLRLSTILGELARA
jgi:hypothetical protein